MLDYIKPLLTLSFWFKSVGEPFLPVFYYALLALFTLLFIAGSLSGIIFKKKKEDFILRFSVKYLKNWFLWAGITGYLWIFFTYERAVFLSSRFWIVIWLIGFGVWLFFIVKKIKNLPQKERELKQKAQFDKYIPKKKK